MTVVRPSETSRRDSPLGLERALEQSHDVKQKVEGVAEELAVSNDEVKQRIAHGVTVLPAREALAEGQRVESTVQECAADLDQVTASLASGIEDLKQLEAALARSRAALKAADQAVLRAVEAESKAMVRALHDAATGLPKRALFDDRLTQSIAMAERRNWTLAVMFIDLDRFKLVNDEHGHAAGDRVLTEVARRMLRGSRDEDTLCRNGGDEFLYLLTNPDSRASIERVATAVQARITAPIVVDGVELVIGASIGIAVYPDDGSDGDTLVRHADAAMYRVKRQAIGVDFYDPASDRRVGDGPA